jgi:hypothetical protein
MSAEPDAYLARARDCKIKARATTDPLAKELFLVLARQWREKAQQGGLQKGPGELRLETTDQADAE